MRTQVFVRNPDGSIEGEIDQFAQVDAIPRFRDVGSWSVKVPATDLADLLGTPSYGVSITREDMTLISGPTTTMELMFDSTGDYVIASGLSDEVALNDRTANPSTFPFTAAATDDRSGPAETVIKGYVSYNVGDPSRKVATSAEVRVAPDLGRGVGVIGSARMDVLLTLVQNLSIAGGNLGFQVKDLVFDVYQPVDRSLEAVFSTESGNLIKVDSKTTAPTGTRIYVAGGGVGTSRLFEVIEDDTAANLWGRHIEVFLDQRQTSDVPTLIQAGQTELARRAAKTTLAITPIDVPHRTFGVDYNLGDIVTAEDTIGVITEVHLTLDQNGETIAPTVDSSSASASSILRAFDEIRQMKTRLLALERNQ